MFSSKMNVRDLILKDFICLCLKSFGAKKTRIKCLVSTASPDRPEITKVSKVDLA